jgi:hypothetical protein
MKLPELLEIVTHDNEEVQVVEIHDVSEANTYGEPEYLFQMMNLHDGDVRPVSETELVNSRREACNV